MADEEDHPSIRRAVSEIDILLGGVKNTEVVNNLLSPSVRNGRDPQEDEAKLRSPYRAVTSPQR